MKRAPYYQADGITLYHGNCLEVEEWLTGDVLVTDPPYGMAYVSNWRKYAPSPIAGDNDPQVRNLALQAWGDRPALVFGSWKVPRPTTTRHRLIWAKGDSPGMGDLSLPWGPGEEEIYVLGEGWTGTRSTNVITVPTMRATAAWRPAHPTPKPLPLMETLLEKCPPGTVVDPFAGSGSTLLAARNQGRPAIGVEIDEGYCEVIASRLAQGVLL